MINIEPGVSLQLPGEYEDKLTKLLILDATLNSSVPKTIRKGLEFLLRMVNSYYSNKIEGNPTHPKDLMEAHYNDDIHMDAAHEADSALREMLISLELQFKESLINEKSQNVASEKHIKSIHEMYYNALPDESKKIKRLNGEIWVKDGKPVLVTPGAYRSFDVKVGRHEPISHEEVPRYMRWIEQMFNKTFHGTKDIVAAACLHHRLAWIHPFEDGNGRTIRLLTDMMMRKAGLGGYGLWSLTRGFGRDKEGYYRALAAADQPPFQPTDGRGALSDKGLLIWIKYYIDTCLDQVTFFSDLIEPQKLQTKINFYFDLRAHTEIRLHGDKSLKKLDIRARDIYKFLMDHGPSTRSEVAAHFGKTEQTFRKIFNQMAEENLIVAKPRHPLEVLLPPHAIEYFFPSIF